MSEPITPDQAIEWIEDIKIDLYAQDRAEGSRVIDLIRTLAARNAELTDALAKTEHRIRELESAARWRSCKDEPPGESGWYLCRVFDKDYADDSRYAEYFTCSFTRGLWITNDMNGCSPDQWTLLPGIHPK